jgi:CheY-like chemotaxis protein
LAHVDANQLELALLNLAVNARDAMPDGGKIAITAQVESPMPDEVPSLMAGPYVAISVKDNGTGMDAATLARAREPFFTTKGVGKGTGLGLAMVHGFAEQSGGALTLDSRPGEGTTATVWLPVAKATQPDASVRPDPQDADGSEPHQKSDLTILAVDDDALVLMNTVAMLEDLGFRVLSAPTAQRALELLDTGTTVDLVVTDEAMPGMRGTQLAEIMREKWPDLPLILATGYAELPKGMPFNLLKLDKPYTQARLKEAIDATLLEQRGQPGPKSGAAHFGAPTYRRRARGSAEPR